MHRGGPGSAAGTAAPHSGSERLGRLFERPGADRQLLDRRFDLDFNTAVPAGPARPHGIEANRATMVAAITRVQGLMMTEPSEQVGTRLMFENDRVRVWDLALAPGETLEKHIHRLDYFYIVESGGLIRFTDPDNPTDIRDVQFQDDQVTFREVPSQGKVDNRLTNIGTKRHRNYVVELKRG